jgi:single-strand DNA-binding protein
MNYNAYIGRVSTDPQYGKTERTTFLSFNLAVDRQDRTDDADFLRIVLWDKLADSMSKYIKKGRLIFVAGQLRSKRYEDKDTKKMLTSWTVHAHTVELLDRPPKEQTDTSTEPAEDEVPFYR